MTKETEKKEDMRKELDKLADNLFPDLSSPQLVKAALDLERTLK